MTVKLSTLLVNVSVATGNAWPIKIEGADDTSVSV
jgi:hypothetical protein